MTRWIGRLWMMLTAAPGVLAAQEVHGRLTDDASGGPVKGAIVILVDATARRLGGALSDDDGRYSLRAPGAGLFTLRIEIVGHKTVTLPPFSLDSGATVDRTARLHLERVQLAAVRVTAARRCGRPDSANAAAASLWAEVRKTLEATRLAQADRRLSVTVSNFERDMTLDSMITNERRTSASGLSENPYTSLPPEQLARDGYRAVRKGRTVLVGPDANVLLSDAFVAGHCFQVASRGTRSGRVGLAFRPEHRSSKVDVEGTLWLDAASAELRTLEFRYVSDPPSLLDAGDGLVEFARAPGGAWLVQRWRIRVPELLVSMRPGATMSAAHSDTTIGGHHEEGGEVLSAVARGTVLAVAPRSGLTLAGTVRDSTTNLPLAGALVGIEGTRFRARTDADGRFSFDSLLGAGVYVVTASHPRAESLGVAIPSRPARVTSDAPAEVVLALPGASAVAAHVCGTAAGAAPARMATGIVRDDAGGLPLAGVLVTALWSSHGESRTQGSTTSSDGRGRWAICGLPRASDVSIVVHRDAHIALAGPLLRASAANAPLVIVRDLPVPRDVSGALIDLRGRSPFIELARDTSATLAPVPRSSGLSGIVLDPSGEIITGARALLGMRGERVPGDTGGVFAFEGSIAGARELRVRAIGFTEVAAPVLLRVGERRRLLVMMSPSVPRLAATRVRGERDGERLDPMRGFEERRRTGQGFYLDRAAIERSGSTRVTDVLRGIAGVTIQPSLAHPGEYDVIMGRSAIARPDCNTFDPNVGADASAGRDTSKRAPTRGGARSSVCPSPDVLGNDGLAANGCRVMWVVDGARIEPGVAGIDGEVRPDEIEAIEVYRGAATLPAQFALPNARCGAVLIWTRKSARKS